MIYLHSNNTIDEEQHGNKQSHIRKSLRDTEEEITVNQPIFIIKGRVGDLVQKHFVFAYPKPNPSPYTNANTIIIVVQHEKKLPCVYVRMCSKPQ